jgi:hypothetical protein
MFRKTMIALATVAALGAVAPTVADARGGFGGGFHGGGFGGGRWHGGGWGLGAGAFAGAVIGGAIASSAYGYYGPYYGGGYYPGYSYYPATSATVLITITVLGKQSRNPAPLASTGLTDTAGGLDASVASRRHGAYLDIRDLGLMLAHVHGAGSEPPSGQVLVQ